MKNFPTALNTNQDLEDLVGCKVTIECEYTARNRRGMPETRTTREVGTVERRFQKDYSGGADVPQIVLVKTRRSFLLYADGSRVVKVQEPK